MNSSRPSAVSPSRQPLHSYWSWGVNWHRNLGSFAISSGEMMAGWLAAGDAGGGGGQCQTCCYSWTDKLNTHAMHTCTAHAQHMHSTCTRMHTCTAHVRTCTQTYYAPHITTLTQRTRHSNIQHSSSIDDVIKHRIPELCDLPTTIPT